ncbi:MAG: hypothetical protein WCW84_06760 [Sulfurimonas sp.]|jgi:hypothetical protein
MVYGEILKRIEHKTNEWIEGLKNEKLAIFSRTFSSIPFSKEAIRSGMYERLSTLFTSKTSDGTILTIPSDYNPSDLLYCDQRRVFERRIMYYTVPNASLEVELDIYIGRNKGGTAHTKEELEKAIKMMSAKR